LLPTRGLGSHARVPAIRRIAKDFHVGFTTSAVATTQNNLGLALGMLGERKKDATLICEALGKQLMTWEVFY
jgi:hypothetical protein